MLTKEFDYKGKKISCRVKGSGPLVVLVHGFGEDGNVWKAQFDLFPENLLLIPDLPGSGGSEMIEDMSMEGMAGAIKSLIDSLVPENEKITIIGHSMGGYITLAFAEKYPETLEAFGLFHSSASADSEEKKETRRKGIKFIQQHGSYEFFKTSTPNLFAPATKEERSHLVTEQIEAVRNVDRAALVSYYESMINRPDRTRVLENSQVPVLFVMGKHDKAVPMEDGLKQCHLPQLSYIGLLQNSGHMGMVEETDRSNKLLTEFVKNL
ncbi:MAG: alpha/beta hydrolase [Chitinophagaceae bacterium]|nr:MAG: alpha/beta hydrolase [Chitinophagaceae bacterium]